MEVYITKSNANRILRKVDLRKVECKDGEIYKHKLYMFSKYEEHQLLAYKALMEDLGEFIKDYYEPLYFEEEEDTYQWVYEKKSDPVYHLNPSCERLHSDYENYKIPMAIRYLGIEDEGKRTGKKRLTSQEEEMVKSNVRSYRNWFEVNRHYLDEDKLEVFLMHLNIVFQLNPPIRTIEPFKLANSGIEIIENDINELERKIDLLIKESGRYFYADKKNTAILRCYGKRAHLGYKDEPLSDNDTGYDDKTVKEFLRDYDQRFKQPLKDLLKAYYRVKYNPELKMDHNLLGRLGFRVCHICKLEYLQEMKMKYLKLKEEKSSEEKVKEIPIDWVEIFRHSDEDPEMVDIQALLNVEDEYNRIREEMSGLYVLEEIASDVQDLTRED